MHVIIASSQVLVSFSKLFNTILHYVLHLDLSVKGMAYSYDIQSTFQALNEMLKMNKTLAYI